MTSARLENMNQLLNQCRWSFLLILFTLSIPLKASIIQTNTFTEVLAHVDSETWVFFDIDDTLFTSSLQMGRYQYYFLDFDDLTQAGFDEETAHTICRLRWNEMQEKCPVCFLEPEILSIVCQIQRTAALTMGLTARGPQTNIITHQQLQSLRLDFSSFSPPSISINLPSRHLYDAGIWFVEFNKKGTSVRQWLENLREHPSKIVFVDDRRHHLENMEQQLSDLDIEFIGIHYDRARTTPFDPRIAKMQARIFPVILSDEKVKEILSLK